MLLDKLGVLGVLASIIFAGYFQVVQAYSARHYVFTAEYTYELNHTNVQLDV